MRLRRLALLAAVPLAALAVLLPPTASAGPAGPPEVPCSKRSDPRIARMTDRGLRLTSSLGLPAGRYALPRTKKPTQLVVLFHGHGNDSCSWRTHLKRVASRGAVAVAMNYSGQRDTAEVENYGWFVRAGATDSIKAAQHFLRRYPSIKQVFAFGVSMGGNSSGLAVASPKAVRANGKPLFDYWIDIEGVNNLIEEYLIARSVAPFNAGGALAQREIEEENGGTLEEVPDKYAEITNVNRAQDMTGLKGAVIVHGLDDGLVPTNQSTEMTAALSAVGVPAHQYTVVGRGRAEAGTTATAIGAGPAMDAAGEEYESPLAGHGWEGSTTHLVIRTGFERLFSLMAGAPFAPGKTMVPGL